MIKKFTGVIARIITITNFDNWPQLIFERVFFRKTTIQIHRKGKLQMVVDHRAADSGSIRTCIGTPMYRQFLDDCRLDKEVSVLDVGANVGGFSLLVKQMGYSFSRLICLELNPETYERLRFNIKTNLGLDSQVENIGVWYKKGEVKVRMGIGSTGDSITPKKGLDYNHLPERLVPTDTLNNIIFKYFADDIIDICKIDIEGAESDILLNAPELCSRMKQIRYLVIEIHHLKTYQKVLNQLGDFQFKLINQEPGKQYDLGVHLFINCAFVNNSL